MGRIRAARCRSCTARCSGAICTRDCGFEGLPGAPWGRSGRNWAQRVVSGGDQRRGDQQQHGRDEQQRDHELDLRRGLRGLLGALGGPLRARLGGLGGERGGEWGAVALGASERGDERRRCRGAGSARSSWSSACSAGSPSAARAPRRVELRGQQARDGGGRPRRARGAARGRRRSRRAAGRARRAARPPSPRRACARAVAAPTRGRGSRPTGAARSSASPSRPGASVASGSAASVARSARPGLQRDDLARRAVEAGGGDAAGEAAGAA